ncbi:FK506-binding protein [Symmachiella dynata]|uniref:family 16 glycoside hydrolase n=1 Tax=Symmachiella dynata TaxID=2527995 RepID=UPI001188EC64|nr:family 16 glycoside hydrolase [Symmachiella dynata]QDT46361.1 FK506-binding protein [Symmachiella dynata]
MHSYRLVVGLMAVAGFALGGVFITGCAQAEDNPPKPPKKSFVPLYNGKDLSGWEVLDGNIEAWKADGELLSCVGEGGGWLRTEEMYSDYVLKLEFRVPPNGNSGVGLRFPDEGNPAFAGMEIQILDDDGDEYTELKDSQYSGSIYSEVAAKRGALKPPGEFNSYEITCKGPFIKVVLNGKTITEANIDEYDKASGDYKPLRDRPRIGYIGLQSHGSRVDFRNIDIKDLTNSITDPDTKVEMAYVDIVEGEGDAVGEGDAPTIHCTGRLLNGEKFYSSHDGAGQPLALPLTGYIPGWQLGIPGMKAGGRRKLIIPYQLAYGLRGFPPSIPPKAMLVFDVEVVKVK